MEFFQIKEFESISSSNTNSMVSPLKKYIEEVFNQYDDYVYDYMSNMILEDSPNNYQDIMSILKDFFYDKLYECNPVKIENKCKEIFNFLLSIGYTPIRSVIKADKLDEIITLANIKVGSDNTITSLKFDANKLTQEKNYQNIIVSENEKFSKDVSDDFRKHMEEIQKNKSEMPEITMHHDRDESYKVNIKVDSFTISIGGKTLFEDATLKINFGRRYVLVGRNGIGKTTLLNYIARKEISGIPKHLQILHVQQEAVANETPLLEEVLKCDVERNRLLNEEKDIGKKLELTSDKVEIDGLTKRLVEVGKRLQEIGFEDSENKAREILLGLGFSEKDLGKSTNRFSGGWRMRISLAKALFVQPDILLLDEPTNHLDMNAVMWLEDYLVSWPYTVVIVSHARDFINNVATDIIHVQNCKLTYQKGNYDEFEKSRAEKLLHLQRQKENQDKQVSHIQEFINRFRANAKRASMVQSRIKTLNKLDVIDTIVEDPSIIFMFPNPEPLNPPLLKLEGADLGYDKDTIILRDVYFNVDMTSRIALVGPNGAGKTTLLKSLTHELEVINGKSYRHNKLKLAMFTQHHVDQLNLEYTPIEQIMSMYGNVSNEKIRSHLASFGINANLMIRPNYLLSGGQKTRVAFAAVAFSNPQLILMDEPTNHLDIDAVNALALALNNFTGGICIVSHDQHFVESVCDRIFVVDKEAVTQFKGTFIDYKKWLKANK